MQQTDHWHFTGYQPQVMCWPMIRLQFSSNRWLSSRSPLWVSQSPTHSGSLLWTMFDLFTTPQLMRQWFQYTRWEYENCICNAEKWTSLWCSSTWRPRLVTRATSHCLLIRALSWTAPIGIRQNFRSITCPSWALWQWRYVYELQYTRKFRYS